MFIEADGMLLFLFSTLAGLSLSYPTDPSNPLPPSQDPWYTAPANYESAEPGAVLRIRAAPGNITSIFANSSAAYNILYRTTDGRYNPSWAVTTLFEPKQTNGSALLSYQIPYDSAFVDYSPSYLLYDPFSPLGNFVYDDIQNALSVGWYVSVPDYEGPLAAFGDGVQSGHATLDSIRAVLNTGFDLDDDARYAMWGFSGGSIASEWAAELQVQYAPELNFSGAALGGLVPTGAGILSAVNGTIWAGLFPSILVGATTEYPAAYNYLVSQLKPSGPSNRTTFLSVRNMTIEEAFVTFNGSDMFAFFTNGSASLNAPVIQDLFYTEATMGLHGVPQMPLLIYKAIADEISHINYTDALVEQYCSVGANIVYQRNTVGGHSAEEGNGDGIAFAWLQSVLTGTYQDSGCTISNVTLNITDSPL